MITKQKWKIGDCLDLLPEIKDKSINMILTDLPYGTTACAWDTVISFESLWKEYKRIITDDGAIVLTASQPFTTKLINSNIEMFKYEWIWLKNIISNPFIAKYQPMKQHENILVFGKGKTKYNPIMEKRLESGLKRIQSGAIIGGTDEGSAYGKSKEIKKIYGELRHPKSFQKFDVERGLHPTQKPVKLFEYLIKTYTDEGDWVHDSCLGSGTTLEACLKTNRNCIGYEISDEWEHYYAKRAMSNIPSLENF